MASRTDETNATSTFGYDNLGRRTTSTDPTAATVSTTYTDWDSIATRTRPLGGVSSVAFDGDRQVTTVTDPVGAQTLNEYDTAGRLSAVVDALGGRTETSYDVLGRPTIVTDPRGSTASRSYTPQGWTSLTTDAVGEDSAIEHDPAGRPIRVADALGQVTQIVYDRAGQKLGVQTPDGIDQTYTVDVMGRLTSHRLPTSVAANSYGQWEYSYTTTGQPATVEDPAGNLASLTYDLVGRVTSRTDQAGTVVSHTYDDTSRTMTITDPLGTVGTDTFDPAGRMIGRADAAGSATTYAYDNDSNLTTVTDPVGNSQSFTYDLAGRPITQTSAPGMVVTANYDPLGRITSRDRNDGTTESFTYDAVGNLVNRTDRAGHSWTYQFDPANRPTTTTDPLGGISTSSYDQLGRIEEQTGPTGVKTYYRYDPVGRLAVIADTTGQATLTTYDRAGNPESITDPGGVITVLDHDALSRTSRTKTGLLSALTTAWDSVGNVTSQSQGQRTTSYQYDIRNRLIGTTDPLGNTTTSTLGPVGNPVSITTPQGHTSNFGYDPSQQLTSATDPAGNTTNYSYNNGQISQVTLPLGGTYTYGYDQIGRTVSETNPAGETINYTHDNLDRVATVTYPSARTVTNTYDAAGRLGSSTDGTTTRQFGYDLAGRLLTATDGSSTLGYAYDNRGLPVESSDGFGITTLTYDDAGRLASQTLPGGLASQYSYDNNGLLETVSGSNDLDYTHDSYGRLALVAGAATSFGGNDTYTYNDNDQITGITGPGYNVTAAYSADGNPTTITQNYTGTNPYASDNTFDLSYDAAGRLVSSTHTQDQTVVADQTFGWDANSNRTSLTVDGTTTTSTFDQADRLTSASDGTTYTYDADGNLTAGPTSNGPATYTYNGFGELATSTVSATSTLARDALGRLKTRTRQGTTEQFGYTGTGNQLSGYIDGANPQVDLLRDPTGYMYAMAPDGGTSQRVSYNVHGDIAMLRNQDPGSAATFTSVYDPFGQPETNGTNPTPTGFQAMITDPHTGHVDMGFRNYSPATGRFTQPDNIIGDLTRPVTLNRYTYGNGSPIRYFDPDGHFGFDSIGNAFDAAINTASNVLNTAVGLASSAGTSITQSGIGQQAASSFSSGLQTVTNTVANSGTISAGLTATSEIARTAIDVAGNTGSSVAGFANDHKDVIASAAAGIGTTAACTFVTGGAATPGCIVAGFAVAEAVSQAMNCPPGRKVAECAAIGLGAGTVGGVLAVSTGGVGTAGVSIARLAFSGGISAGGTSFINQYLLTGEVDYTQAATQALIGAALNPIGDRLGSRLANRGGYNLNATQSGLNSSNALDGVERASPQLLGAVGQRRTVQFALPGSEDLRYLDSIGAEANVGGADLDHILLRSNPSRAAVLEEFLHGTQQRLGIVDRLGVPGAERHVKDFMIRHQRMLGLGEEDVRRLQVLMEAGL